MSNELVQVDENTPISSTSFPMVDVESAKAFMDCYQEVVEALLDKGDYQKMGKNQFKKKSAWRKLATAFNITDEVVGEKIATDENGQIISAKYYVKATLPNGRSSVGVGACSIYDKITKKDKSQPSDFVLRLRFNNAEHDVPSTAHTRAKSRAISDLIGAGEVSAEEMDGMDEPKKAVNVTPKNPKPKAKTTPKPKTEPKKVEKPSKDEEAIEVQVIQDEKQSKKPIKTIKSMIEENTTLKKIVEELQSDNRVVNKHTVSDLLFEKLERGAIKETEFKEARKVMEE